jgi:hypothetical protein
MLADRYGIGNGGGRAAGLPGWQGLSHARWYCRYQVVLVPKHRKKSIFGQVRNGTANVLRQLCEQEGVELVEGHALADYLHLEGLLRGPSSSHRLCQALPVAVDSEASHRLCRWTPRGSAGPA